jgi:hypothetical protein
LGIYASAAAPAVTVVQQAKANTARAEAEAARPGEN